MHRYERWRDVLLAAPTPSVVVKVVQDYARTLPVEVRSILPNDCFRALHGPIDVQSAALILLKAEIRYTGDAQAKEFLHEVARTLAAASVLIASMESRGLNRRS